MLDLSLLKTDRILTAAPKGPFTDDDMAELRDMLTSLTADGQKVKGLLIDAQGFPGYADFSAFTAHMQVVRDFHDRIAKLAFVSDAAFASAGEMFARTFLGVDARHFGSGQKDAAIAWLKE